jgi:exosortase D (VPLPA-CTERM-specific)
MVAWWDNDYYCRCVPLVIAYLLWRRRKEPASIPSAPSWYGICPVAAGVLLYFFGEVGGEFYALFLSSWCILFGMYWMEFGWQKTKAIQYVFILLLIMLPLPNFAQANLTSYVQLVSSRAGTALIQLYGIPVYIEGNTIDLGVSRLAVTGADSVIDQVIPTVGFGLIFACCFRGPFWKRALLLLSTIPITIAAESFRVAAMGILRSSYGMQSSTGLYHDLALWMVRIIMFALLWGEIVILRKIGAGFSPVSSKAYCNYAGDVPWQFLSAENAENKGGSSVFLKSAMVLVLLGGTFAAMNGMDFGKEFPLKQPLAQFPLQVGLWEGTRRYLDTETVQGLHLSDYTMVDFGKKGGGVVGCYVAYCARQRKGESIHTPATCLPGTGWVFQEAGTISLAVGANGKTSIKVSRAFIQKAKSRQLIYYWFPQRGRILTNLFQLKFFTFWDALTRGRTDGALVRLITPLGEFEEPEWADARMRDFCLQLLPVLDKYLPE